MIGKIQLWLICQCVIIAGKNITIFRMNGISVRLTLAPQCAIPMHLFDGQEKIVSGDNNEILQVLNAALKEGKIAAVKGIGGYLLLCDATNAKAIETLRERKHRPAKPFALLYKDIDMALKDLPFRRRNGTPCRKSQHPLYYAESVIIGIASLYRK